MAHLSQSDEAETAQTIQADLRQLSAQLGHLLDADAIQQLYQSAEALVSQLAPDSLTIARVAGVLLVYQISDADPEEAEWFKTELRNCHDEESVDELIDLISRSDAL
jgi:hypothetical protein